jgi:hypothetical protein
MPGRIAGSDLQGPAHSLFGGLFSNPPFLGRDGGPYPSNGENISVDLAVFSDGKRASQETVSPKITILSLLPENA